MRETQYSLSGVFDMIEVKISDNYDHAYKPHLHAALSIGIIEKGQTVLNVKGIDYTLGEGDAVVIGPYVTHLCQPVDIQHWAFTMIYIDKAFYETFLSWSDQAQIIGFAKLGADDFMRIQTLVETLKAVENDFNREVELADALNHVLSQINVFVEGTSTEQSRAVKAYIDEHFKEVITLDELAERFDINKFTLIRQFRRAWNATPSAYQLQLKVAYAKELLSSDGSLAGIAVDAGFFDQAHFTREFKKAVGISPQKYRESMGE